MKRQATIATALAVMAVAPLAASAATRVWTGEGTDHLASNAANWDGGIVPEAGDDVVFDATSTADCTWDLDITLGSWTMADGYSGTVTISTVFAESGFDCLQITGDMVVSNGVLAHLSNADVATSAQPNRQLYRLRIDVGGDFVLATNALSGNFGRIDLRGLGRKKGPGYATGDRGGSYGGSTESYPDKCYGSVKLPVDTGSGANYGTIPGGGAFHLTCAGDAVIDGTVKADGALGTDGNRSASGGSILIRAKTVTGSGLLSASGYQEAQHAHGGGGGGRIALYATKADATHADFMAGVETRPSKKGTDVNYHASGGTMYFEVPSDNGRGVLKVSNYGQTGYYYAAYGYNYNYRRTSLLASMQSELNEGFSKIVLSSYAQLGVDAGATLDLTGTEFICDSTCRLYVYGTIVTPATYDWTNINIHVLSADARFGASGTTILGSGATLHLQSAAATFAGNLVVGNGGQIVQRPGASYFMALNVDGDLRVDNGGLINATSNGSTGSGVNKSTTAGYPSSVTSSTYSGSSYGGRGGPDSDAADYTTACWGSIREPAAQGASGTKSAASRLRLTVAGNTRIDGTVTAAGVGGDWFGASGGSLILTTATLSGAASGNINAVGGFAWNKAAVGGGGRIAITLTDPNATFNNYLGHIVAFGTWKQTSTSTMWPTAPAPTSSAHMRSGAGSIYLRAKNAAIDRGALIYDQGNPAYIDSCAVSEITSSMPDTAFGEVIVRNKARLVLGDGVEITSSVWSNKSVVTCAPTSKLTLVPDALGNAYVFGSTSFGNFAVDPAVRRVYFEAGTTNSFTSALEMVGEDAESRIQVRSTVPGQAFYLNASATAIQTLDYLDVADSDATPGAELSAQHSTNGGNTTGWSFQNIEPGTAIHWNGSTDTSWGNADNWVLVDGTAAGRIPVATDLVTIRAGTFDPTLPSSAVTISNLTVLAGATLTMNGYDLTVNGALTLRGTLAVTDAEAVTLHGAVDLAGGTFVPANGEVVVSTASASALAFAGTSFGKIRFATSAAPLVTTGWKAATTTIDAGTSLRFASTATNETVVLFVDGTANEGVTLAPQTAGGAYILTVSGYAAVSHAGVAGADSSRGAKVFAADSTDGGGNQNWVFSDTRKVWLGTSSTAFATAANWQGGEVPDAGDDVVVAANASRIMAISTEGVSLGSLTVLGQGVSLSAPVEVAESVALVAGTMTVDKPLTIGGSFVVLEGATITHTALPSGATAPVYACDITVAGDMLVAAGASITAIAKGYPTRFGPGYGGVNRGGSHGGTCGIRSDASNQGISPCYGSVLSPADCGSGGYQGGNGGGLILLDVGGTFTLDGSINASARSGAATDCRGASGGGVRIRAARLVGKGTIRANGEHSTANCFAQGGGGRISVVLTDGDFAAFSGTILALGGFGATQNCFGGGCGTVYLQSAAQADGTGVVRLDGSTDFPLVNSDSARTLPYSLAGFGFAGDNSLRFATLSIGANAGLYLFGDKVVGDLVFTGENTSTFPASINFNGYKLYVRQQKPTASEKATKVRFNNYYNGTYDDNIVWLRTGTRLMLR